MPPTQSTAATATTTSKANSPSPLRAAPSAAAPSTPPTKKSFRTCPRRLRWLRHLYRVAMLLALAAILIAAIIIWLYWGWKSDKSAAANLKIEEANQIFWEPIGPPRLKTILGSHAWLLDRVTFLNLPNWMTDADLTNVGKLRHLQKLWVSSKQITDAGIAYRKSHLAHGPSLGFNPTH